MDLNPWSQMARATELNKCLAGWKRVFGRCFEQMEKYLPGTGDVSGYPHPNGSFDLCVEGSGNEYRAFRRNIAAEDWVEPIDLDFREAEAHAFDVKKVLREVCGRLGCKEQLTPEGGGLFRLGRCKEGKAVYAYLGPAGDALRELPRILESPQDVGCVLVAELDSALEDLSRLSLVSFVALPERFKLEGDGVTGTCGEGCKTVRGRRPLTCEELDDRLGSIGQSFGAMKAENMRLKAELAQNILNVVKKADPDFIRNVMCVLAAGSVNKAAKRLGIPNSTFSGKLKLKAAERASHQAMYRMIQMRQRKCGVKSIERFNETWDDHQGAQGADSIEALLKAVVEGLEKMSPVNFSVVRDELIKECAPFL